MAWGIGKNTREPFNPTPEEIKQACREIQATWDTETELLRRVVKPVATKAPKVKVHGAKEPRAADAWV
jgi:hypothetical protein